MTIDLPVLLARKCDISRLRMIEVNHATQGGRLPRAVRSEKPGHPAGLHRKVQIIDSDSVSEALRQPFNGDHSFDPSFTYGWAAVTAARCAAEATSVITESSCPRPTKRAS